MNPWWNYSWDLARSGIEAQRVIALRMMKLAKGGPGAGSEMQRMLVEKWLASAEAAAILARGGTAPRVLRRYRAIMRANERRLKGRKPPAKRAR